MYYTDSFCLCQQIKTVFVYNKFMNILFAERLKSLRREKGLKQEELAKELGLTQRKISYWENGVTEPDLAALWKLSDYFGVSVDYLLGKSDY